MFSVSRIFLSQLAFAICFFAMMSLYTEQINYGTSQGFQEGGLLRNSIKFLGIALFFVAYPRIDLSLIKENKLMLLVIAYFFFSYFFFLGWNISADKQLINFFLCSLLFIGFGLGKEQIWIDSIFKTLPYVYLLSLVIEVYVFANEFSIFDNLGFVGSVGNPSSFGFLSCLVFYYSVIYFESSKRIFFSLVSFIGLVMSGSMAPALAFFILGLSFFILTGRFTLFAFYFCLIIFGFSTLLLIYQDSDIFLHQLSKLIGLLSFLSGEEANAGSIDARVEIFSDLITGLQNIYVLLFGHLNGLAYIPRDSFIAGMSLSFGVPATLFFLFSVLKINAFDWEGDTKLVKFSSLGLIGFLFMMIPNRILDYWPLPLIFVIMIIVMVRRNVTKKELSRL